MVVITQEAIKSKMNAEKNACRLVNAFRCRTHLANNFMAASGSDDDGDADDDDDEDDA